MPLRHLFLCPLGCISLASSLYGLEATGTPAVMLEVLSHFMKLRLGLRWKSWTASGVGGSMYSME